MISSRKLIKLARKWHQLASLRRKRITWPRVSRTTDEESCSVSSMAEKGHCVVYSCDGRRFEILLTYLQNQIVAELLQAAEVEFGPARDGPITLPCDGVLFEYALYLIKRRVSEDIQKVLAVTIASGRCSSYSE
ncbi:hypothetical protein Droror1_Dr00007150 [Drosera rotundifolia]